MGTNVADGDLARLTQVLPMNFWAVPQGASAWIEDAEDKAPFPG